MQKTIPIVHCFDNNFVIPAAVAFYSMLEYSNKGTKYILYVLHTDITARNQEKLQETISDFNNAEIVFVNMENKFEDVFNQLKIKNHFSKEVIYKILTPSLFPQYDKLIISDVDVVYLANFEQQFFDFNTEHNDNYLAGFRGPAFKKESAINKFLSVYKNDFNNEEIEKLNSGVGGGFLICNLKKMRKDNIEEKFLECLTQNTNRLIQLEQDVINLVCYPQIEILRKNTLVCTYLYDLYKADEILFEDNYTEQDLKYVLDNPVQLHYAGGLKPWKNPSCTKSEHWYYYLLKTPFFYEQMDKLESALLSAKQNFASLPLKRKIKLTLNHIAKKILSR